MSLLIFALSFVGGFHLYNWLTHPPYQASANYPGEWVCVVPHVETEYERARREHKAQRQAARAMETWPRIEIYDPYWPPPVCDKWEFHPDKSRMPLVIRVRHLLGIGDRI